MVRISWAVWRLVLMSLVAASSVAAVQNYSSLPDDLKGWCNVDGTIGYRGWTDRGLQLHPDEYAALLAFRSATGHSDVLLDNWSDKIHPCEWCGVICDCQEVYPAPAKATCPPGLDTVSGEEKIGKGNYYNDFDHVFGIDFGIGPRPKGSALVGTIPTELGNLVHSKVFYLHGNSLTGTLPTEIGRFETVSRWFVRDNALTGTLPTELGNWRLRDLYMEGNNFQGTIPQEWCKITDSPDSSISAFFLRRQEGLCGELPADLPTQNCTVLRSMLEAPGEDMLSGTCLISEVNPDGGTCDTTPPVCEFEANGSSCLTTSTIINTVNQVTFNFSGLVDPNSGIRSIEWCMGTNWSDPLGMQNTVPRITLPMDVDSVDHELTGVSLTNGQHYYITVKAINNACPAGTKNLISDPILVDSTPPTPAYKDGVPAVFTSHTCERVSTQTLTDRIDSCWHEFKEPESGIAKYEMGVYKVLNEQNQAIFDLVGEFSADGVKCVGDKCTATRKLTLDVNAAYSVEIRAFNLAGDLGEAQSASIKIVSAARSDDDGVQFWIMIVFLVVGLLCLMAAARFIILDRKEAKARFDAEIKHIKELEKLEEELQKTLASAFGQSIYGSGAGAPTSGENIASCEELVFVFTDIQDSTMMAAHNPALYKHVQDMHDDVIREQLFILNGYEINTQGDSFEIAFRDVSSALRFCMQTQLRLLQAPWSPEVLDSMPSCNLQLQGNVKLYAGPRVRMGVHLATKGTFSSKYHKLTKHVQFDGSSYHHASVLGDVAHGGQILMSHTTFISLEKSGTRAESPVVLRHLGRYLIGEKATKADSVYEVLPPAMSKMPQRQFPAELRNCIMTNEGFGFHVTNPPEASPDGFTTIVVLKCADKLSEATEKQLKTLIESFVQLFNAYVVQVTNGAFTTIACPTAASAVRLGLVLQMGLLAAPWEGDAESLREERDALGNILYRGPRLSMLVHACSSISKVDVTEDNVSNNNSREVSIDIPRDKLGEEHLCVQASAGSYMKQKLSFGKRRLAVYSGPGLALAEDLIHWVYPGQLMVTEKIWMLVQDSLPRLTQVLSLGVNTLPNGEEMSLLELLPLAVSKRTFPPVPSPRILSPGYRQSPDVNQWLVIMFAKVMACPLTPPGMEEATYTKMFYTHVEGWCDLVRSLLVKFDGYECKEPEKGKFTLAFKAMENAMAFSVTVQKELMDLNYEDTFLQGEGVGLEHAPNGEVISRGLRASIGMAWGKATFRKPLASTGRADYYGPLPNKAARLMGAAAPGQVIIDGTYLHDIFGEWVPSYIPSAERLKDMVDNDVARVASKTGSETSSEAKMMEWYKRSKTSKTSQSSANPLITFLRHVLFSISSGTAGSSALTANDLNIMQAAIDLSVWEAELPHLPGTSVGPVKLKSLGLFQLKGIFDPVPLVMVSLPGLYMRKLQVTKTSITPDFSVQGFSVGDDFVARQDSGGSPQGSMRWGSSTSLSEADALPSFSLARLKSRRGGDAHTMSKNPGG